MRKLFPGYFRPTEEEFMTWWQQGVFAFDANVLLNIYRYTPKTRETLLEILNQLQERLWLPHQAAYEYHQNRLEVITHQLHAYAEIEKKLDESLKKLETELRGFQRHPFVDVDQVLETLKRAMKRAKSHLQHARANHPDLLVSDDLREELVELFEDKVGEPFPTAELERIYKQSEQRFKQDIPPGFEDLGKKGSKKYGDVVLWFQLIEFAKAKQKPLIFTTDDRKEDWWLKHDGRTIGPRPELIQEMLNEAGVQFYMYSTDQFMKYAQSFLKLREKQEAIEEVRQIRRHDERSGITASQLLALRSLSQPSAEDRAQVLKLLREYLAREPVESLLESIHEDTKQSLLKYFTPSMPLMWDVIRSLAAQTSFTYGQDDSEESSELSEEGSEEEASVESDEDEMDIGDHTEEEPPSDQRQQSDDDTK